MAGTALSGTRSHVKFDANCDDIPSSERLSLSIRWAQWDADVWGFGFDIVGRPKLEGGDSEGRGMWEADWFMSEREARSLMEFLQVALARLP